ncbi:MAG: B12-binding domain-containing protein [Octadecabacter sp.]|nr:B12-binding domain-containing protein [Octadecabacter sp.]
MTQKGKTDTGFDPVRYVQTKSELLLLKSRLPEEEVQSFAREVIRRLADRQPNQNVAAPAEDDIEELCHALLDEDDAACGTFIQELRADGASVEAVYLTYLAGAARMLGDWWEQDRISFAGTALGTARMYAIMRAIRSELDDAYSFARRSAVFVAVPGESHVLGVRMATDLFRKDGWDIDLKINKDHDLLVKEISTSGALLIGISASGDEAVVPLSKLVIALRISNPVARIFVSGRLSEASRTAVGLIGVDAIVATVDEAKEFMNTVWDTADRNDPAL